ncbi:hypothetical protein SLEP1_g7803 [Rubroshorea leprosula]|uniref:non-specific serine/threonine protein kinase n=1 Tax=Rubroshorea leprosula TaxID=152421 RepID=A0AAV5IAJ0_9ROSI|nr:hypothetical protein SLEP1_g7803 [Rubroshorea leprosula]
MKMLFQNQQDGGEFHTKSFNRQLMDSTKENFLGRGSFGLVYSGILQDGMNIAIKVFNLQVEDVLRRFDAEREVLSSIRHRNLIKIISRCCNEDFKALRLYMMKDVASALEYLHHGHPIPIIHYDLKPSNVLLDEDMVAHVGDFGLAKLMGVGESMMQTTRIATIGYMALEYGSLGMVSTKGDIYSYGILLMETFTRRKPTDELFTGEMSLKLWVRESLSYSVTKIVDPNLINREEKHYNAKINCVTSIMELALNYCAESPRERPNVMDVAAMIKKIKEKYLKDC